MSKELTLNLLRDRHCNNCGNYIWILTMSTDDLNNKTEAGLCGIAEKATIDKYTVCEKWVKK